MNTWQVTFRWFWSAFVSMILDKKSKCCCALSRWIASWDVPDFMKVVVMIIQFDLRIMFQVVVGPALILENRRVPKKPTKVHLCQWLEHQRLAESSRTLWKWGIQPDLQNLVHKKVGWVGCKDIGVFWCQFFWRFFCETWLLRLILRKVTSVNSPILPILFQNQKGLIFKKRNEKTQPKTPQRVSRTLGVSLDCVTSCWFVQPNLM